MRKCPPGAQGPPGRTCKDVNADIGIFVVPDDYGVMRKCPVKPNGNNGASCYEVFKSTLPECTESTPGVNSVDCINPDTPNVKTCGVINPDKPSDVANNLSINGNTLTINNNEAISFKGNSIKLPADGKIVFKNVNNNNIIETINKSYIDDMILKSQQCKKCPDKDGKKFWNNSYNCQQEQGECKECSECKSGEYYEQACSQHTDTVCKQCNGEYVGIECATRCDPKEGKIPNSSKSECTLIQAHQYINNGTVEVIPDGYYRNPNDATVIIVCKQCSVGQYVEEACSQNSNTKCNNCPSGTVGTGGVCEQCGSGQGPNSDSTQCVACPVGTASTNGICVNCGRGKYQDQTGKSSCKNCPANKGGGGISGRTSSAHCAVCTSSQTSAEGQACQNCQFGLHYDNKRCYNHQDCGQRYSELGYWLQKMQSIPSAQGRVAMISNWMQTNC